MHLKQLLAIAIFFFMSLTGHTIMAQSGTSTLAAGSSLTEGQRLVSANQVYYLGMQTDGNLCIKKVQDDGFVWCSMAFVGSGCHLILQADGNLVVYDKNNKAVWFSMTQAYFDPKFGTADWKPVRAVIEDNGILCLYSATNKKVWTNADKKEAPIVDPGVGFTGPTVKKNLSIRLPMASAPANYNVEINNRGEVFYNGDINLGTLESLTQNAQAPQDVNSYKWPNSTIPYVLPNNHLRRDIIQKGIEFLNANTTICLVPKTKDHTDYVEFIARDGNWSMIGRVGGRQEISVENNNIGTVIHEIMHALGFHHTQCREDRDKFVTINISNVQKGMEHNFEKCIDKQSNLGVYDYTSCMHYPSYGFAVNKNVKTIIRKDGKDEEMGDWDGMSATDIANIAVVYSQCPGKPPVNPTTNPTTAACDAKDAAKKYQSTMKPGERLSEKEKIVSANGKFHFRVTTDGNYVIEEILNSGNCPYKEVYRFPLVNGGSKPAVSFFSYNPDGNVCMDNKLGKTYCATNGQDAVAAVILQKSIKLELTDDGRLRLVNNNGEEIWATKPAPTTNPTTKPTTEPTTTTSGNDAFIKGKSILNFGERLNIGQTLTSENNQYQCRIVKQSINVRGGTQEQNRFVIEKITVVNGLIVTRVEIWNKECKEGFIEGKDLEKQSRHIFPSYFYDVPPTSAALQRNKLHFGQLKLEDNGKLKLYYDGHRTVNVCPYDFSSGSWSNTEMHYRTSSELIKTPGTGSRLEKGQTLTSDNNQYQCRITPENRFVIEKITVSTKENGEKLVDSRVEIWNKECKEGFIELAECTRIPDCFKKEIPVKDPTKPSRGIPCIPDIDRWKLEDTGIIRSYKIADTTGIPVEICNPYK